jgi:predicted permease
MLSAVIVASLAAGLGVNTVVFSWFQALVLEPVPGVARAGDLQFVEPRSEAGGYPGASFAEYEDLRERLDGMEGLVAFRSAPLGVGEPGRIERTFGQFVSDNYFDALGLRPALGRFPASGGRAAGATDPVVVISYDYWQTRFDAAPDALGRTLRVNDRLLTIGAVTPKTFQGTVLGLAFDLWIPAALAPELTGMARTLDDRRVRGFTIAGRLRPGVPRAAVQAELDEVMRRLGQEHPSTNATIGADVLPFWQAPRGPQRLLVGAVVTLQAVLLLLLLTVCANTASLLLARTSSRESEMAVRLALGARRWQVARLLLAECAWLALLATGLGTAIAVWGTNALRAIPLPAVVPIRFQTSVDLQVLAFAATLGVLACLLVGAAPAARASRLAPHASLRAGSQGSNPRRRLGALLMGLEAALAVVVLLAAALFLMRFADSRETDPGFRRDGVLLAAYDLGRRDADAEASANFAARLLDRVRALPGVEAAAIAGSVPLDIHGMPRAGLTIEGQPRADGRRHEALMNTVTPGYFAAMDLALVAGTDFVRLDDDAAPAQAIVNETFARTLLGDRPPLGRRLWLGDRPFSIAGVVADAVYDAFGEPPTPVVYFSYRDRPGPRGELHVRTRAGTEERLAPALERIVRELDPMLPLYDVRTLADHVDRNLFLRRVPARMFAVLGPMLLVLAAIGIYGVVSHGVSRRTSEIGMRLALGGTTARVVRLFVMEALEVVSLGALAGWIVAAAVASLLPGAFDPAVFVSVPLVLVFVAALAAWLPARYASRIQPVEALRRL